MCNDSYSFAQSDGANRIAKWTARIRRGNFFIKINVFSLLLLTFDRFMKQLSKFEGRSCIHHDSLAFRLNRDPIMAGIVVINH